VDVNGQTAPLADAHRRAAPDAAGPRVLQSVASRVETIDSVLVNALGNGLTFVGFELRMRPGMIAR